MVIKSAWKRVYRSKGKRRGKRIKWARRTLTPYRSKRFFPWSLA